MKEKLGYIKAGNEVYSYSIGNKDIFPAEDKGKVMVSPYPNFFKVANYTICPNGENNLGPNIVKIMIGANRLLPELLEKKIKMMYGNGPMLFKIKKQGTKAWREYLDIPEINTWLESWKERGLQDDYKRYLLKTIKSYYYENCSYSKYRLTKGALVNVGLPVAGLESISPVRARIATTADMSNRTDIVDEDFDKIIVGNWLCLTINDYIVYPRFNYQYPLRHSEAVAYSKNVTYGEEVYSKNEWFAGIQDWIRGSNLTPAYINDYLRNALSARMHIIIPNRWVKEKRGQIEDLAALNLERSQKGEELLKIIYDDRVIEVGTEYNYNTLLECINAELVKLTNYLSGEGKNQGKVYSSISYLTDDRTEERWKIEEIPQKYKEYIEALTSYDKRADEVMLSAIGLDPSISNVTKEGVISKSGSDSYYNYMIYLNSLTIAEEVICSEINNAIKLNFPKFYEDGVRLGFYRALIEKQEDVSEQNRMSNQENM